MIQGEKRSIRLRLLDEIYEKSNFDKKAVITRALKLGVSNKTAHLYLKTIVAYHAKKS